MTTDLLSPQSLQHYITDAGLWPGLLHLLEGGEAQEYLNNLYNYVDEQLVSDAIPRPAALELLKKIAQQFEIFPQQIMLEDVVFDYNPVTASSFAIIYKGQHEGKAIALKYPNILGLASPTNYTTHQLTRIFRREVAIWCLLRNPYIQPFIGGIYVPNTNLVYAVSHWCDNGTVNDFIKSTQPSLPRVNSFIFEIALGLKYLHFHAVTHGDLRGANVLVSDDGKALLTDFGLATYTEEAAETGRNLGLTTKALQKDGAKPWMAPELVDDSMDGLRRTVATDVYAFACTVWELDMGGAHPWSPWAGKAMYKLTMDVIAGKRPPRPTNMCDGLWAIVEECWAQDAAARPGMDAVITSLSSASIM
ncbi:kinase-like protein [Heliocybe sulcata]|uniref:Kinase-like protein n=1 Tax=Heliocybe sulcata TaxID=5364 RepID=A0A5C3N5N5_9AGAM|nr:kinase-like protein [Heliocybe sulcata]